MEDRVAEGLEHGSTPGRAWFVRATDHDEQPTLGHGWSAAADRGVDQVDPLLPDLTGETDARVGVDRRMDDHGATGPHAGEHAVLGVQDLLYVRVGDQPQADHLTGLADGGG